ncbi:uncharacterized protein LOC128227077 [Mya arenaria]|uniref:uncharacterized protein LOC128227077 n=1 Tax=Mya arenaria TaxID=6604 RepID=UPI0022E2FAC8|nr:uncharacterized protein LOC128227077 [Mya arenaria]
MDLADFEPSIWPSLLVIKNEHSPPQHCYLQIILLDISQPLPEEMPIPPGWNVDLHGQVFLMNTWLDYMFMFWYGEKLIKHGPSKSLSEKLDMVVAFYCSTLHPECQALMTRPKPGHWPRPEILAKASQSGTFLVPQGHAESDQKELEWRFATPLIERLLMFDLGIVQIQVYIFLKILRKSFLKPLVGDRLSTFHFKTALLFTVETYPPEIWQEQNLLQCVIYCLKTLQRWFAIRHCPHYTISGVDLFVGKLKKWEFALLSNVVSDMICNIMPFVGQISMDQIGVRMISLTEEIHEHINSRPYSMLCIITRCLRRYLAGIYMAYDFMVNIGDALPIQKVCAQIENYIALGNDEIRPELLHSRLLLNQLTASMCASLCLKRNQPIPADIYRLYEESLDSDLTSSRLKLASMFYCNGQYESAEFVLSHTEGLLHPSTHQLHQYRCDGRYPNPDPSKQFQEKIAQNTEIEIFKSHIAFNVVYSRLEECCLPAFLCFEMHRTKRPEDRQRRCKLQDIWMDLAIIDSIPFLYYLQYLTYRQLGEYERTRDSLVKLLNYCTPFFYYDAYLTFLQQEEHGQRVYPEHEVRNDPLFERRGGNHIDTALHVLGHCFELENRHDMALLCYRKSLELIPYNNAATWHIERLEQA